MKINKITILTFVLVTVLAVTACTTNDAGLDTRNRNLSTQTRINDTRWNTGTGNDNINRNMNEDINDFGQNDRWNNNTNMPGQGRTGMMGDNLADDFGNDNMNNNLNNGMTRSNNNSTNMDSLTSNANDIARKITDLPEVDRASVVLTNDTALVGCSLRGTTQGTMTTDLKQKIEKIVKDKTNIEEVSITTDPDLYKRIDTMSNNIGTGNPIENFAEEVRDLIRRITPGTNNRTTR